MDHVASKERESAKQRSRRIPLDYYRHPTRLERIKWLLTLIVGAAAGLYVLWLLAGWRLGSERAARQLSPAPLAGVHAAWDAQCAACHVTGANLRSDANAVALLARSLVSVDGFARRMADDRCSACHAGPAHHANQIEGQVVSCAACHRDHQGKDADLTQVADWRCTECHRNLTQHRDPARPSVAAGEPIQDVTDWQSHPQFRSIGGDNNASFVDPGRLKFNHALHMLPGQAPQGAKESAQKKWGSIDKPYRATLLADQWKGFTDEMVVQLTCASCHQLEGAGGAAVPALGAYMQPIRFAQHCAACHQGELAVDAHPPGSRAKDVPHGLAAGEIRQFIQSLSSPAQQVEPRQPLSPKTPLQPIPGRTPGANLAQTIDRDAADRVMAVEAELLGEHRCGKCHEFQTGDAGGLMPEVEPTAIPTVWLKHARFDHTAHRAVSCYECHDARYFEEEPGTKPPPDGQTPMIPNREVCARCHAPATEQGTAGVRFDCALCHRYHGGNLGPHGKGALERSVPPHGKLNLRQFMSGGTDHSASPPASK